jgi:uncharacterized protein YuzB (UPF0349 family)
MHMNVFFAKEYILEQESTCDVSSIGLLEFGCFQHCITCKLRKASIRAVDNADDSSRRIYEVVGLCT